MEEELHDEKVFIKSISKRIKLIRLAKGMRQNEIAYRCNFDKSSYNNIESGKRNITLTTLYKIGKALGVSVEEFFKNID